MLLELTVTDFAIIEKIHINLRPGFNVITGETGAGKSILLKSLALLMGQKASGEVVRSGAEVAVVEGLFDLSHRKDLCTRLADLGIESADSMMIVRRVISAGGKNRVYINGTLNNLATLQSLMAPDQESGQGFVPLIELTGQHENRSLLSKAYHLNVLDHFSRCLVERGEFEQLYHRYKEINVELERLYSIERVRAQRLDFLTFQRQEMAALDLAAGEDQLLESEYRRLKNSSKLLEFSEVASDTLFDGEDSVLKVLQRFLARAGEVGHLDPKIEETLKPISEAKSLIEEAGRELCTYARVWESDPERLLDVETKISRLRQLERKFGPTLDDVLKARSEIEREIQELTNVDNQILELKKELVDLEGRLATQAKKLHKVRMAQGAVLAQRLNRELRDLNMKGAEVLVQVRLSDEMQSTGQSDVEFLIQSSKSDAARPIGRVASGGELSRILLALKNVVGSQELHRTYLFDEVDAGVSGTTAERIGQKLKAMATSQQVICITHLPQVAALAETHLSIQKSQRSDGRVHTQVVDLGKDQRVRELARLISGEKITRTSLAHAEELLRLPKAKRPPQRIAI